MPKDYKDIRPRARQRPHGHPAAARHDHRPAAGHRDLARGRAVAQPPVEPVRRQGKPIEPVAKIAPTQPPKPEREGRAGEGRQGQARRREGRRGSPHRAAALRVLHDPPRREGGQGQGGQGRCRQGQGARQRRPRLLALPPKPHSGETYWLQAGAFAEEKDADNLKAKIAFTGLEANVKAAEHSRTRAPCTASAWAPTRASTTRTESRPRCPRTGSAPTIIRTDEAKNR